MAQLRLVTWNIRDLLGDPLAVHRVLRALEPDVVCLQEAPRRPGGGLRIGRVAAASGLRHVGGGRTSGGTALLVAPRVEVESVNAFQLPVAHWHTRRRGAVIARVASDGLRAAVASVHLPLTPQDRLRHAESVRDALARWATSRPSAAPASHPAPAPAEDPATALVIAGDFNEPESSLAWQAFLGLVRDPAPGAAPTFPANNPGGRIDAVLVSAGLEVVSYGDGGVDRDDVRRASDHIPVLAVLRSSS